MSTKMPLRAALIGCGRIGAFTRPDLQEKLGPNWLPLSHADALQSVDGIELVACCDSDGDNARKAAARYGSVHVYSDYERLLTEQEPDIVSIATRSDVRPALLKAAAAAGVRAIHTEKPLGLSLAECEAACQALAAAKVALSYGAVRRYMPVYLGAKHRVESGDFGVLYSVVVKLGRTGLMWNHPHSIDLMCLYAGTCDVLDVQALFELPDASVSGRCIDADPVVLGATVRFANGVTGHIVPMGGLCVELGCEQGCVSVVADGSWIEYRRFSQGRAADPVSDIRCEPDTSRESGRLLAMRELRDVLQGSARPSISVDELLIQHRILFALAQSHLEGGRKVTLDEVDPEIRVTGRAYGKVA